jgi:peroxiredoxin Q/BCP
MPAEQALAPAFELKTDADQVVKLADYQGQWVVLYFFPKAMTPG